MPEARRIMAVSAHPADFCSRSGGTLIKHTLAGDAVRVVWLTHGETDESGFLFRQNPQISVEEVRRIREAECVACVGVMGIEGRMLGLGDGPLRMTEERLELLAAEIRDFRPNILLTHWKDELTYPTHLLTAQAAVTAALRVRGVGDIRFFEPNIGTAGRVGFVPDHYVDITEVFARKVEALQTLAAQPELVGNYTACNRWRGIECGCQYAEGFVRFAPVVPRLQSLAG
ncbi:MAG: PIG-L deacetylase family protein [Candidatus Latescibacterota bacterium]